MPSIWLQFIQRRFRLVGSTLPMWGSHYLPYAFDAHGSFLSRVFGFGGNTVRYTPSQIVTRFNDDPELLNGVADFAREFARNGLASYPQFKNDPTTWSVADRRNVIVQKKTNSDGHYIYSGAYEPNRRPDMVENYNAAIHCISTFPAGGGFLIPKELYLESVANGRGRKRFPPEVFGNNIQVIQDYTRKVYDENRSLQGEIVILGNNAVQIKDHVIIRLNGATYQIVRPETMAHHVFYDGHAIWVLARDPAFPAGTFHMYLGHGVSDVSLLVSLGDRLNTGSGVPTFKDVFRAAITSYEHLNELIEQFGPDAVLLALHPDVALAIDDLLINKDPALLQDRKLLTALDNWWPADYLRFLNPYTPAHCYGKELRAPTTAALLGAGGGECDITEVEVDDFVEANKNNPFDTMEALVAAFDKFPVTSSGEEGLFTPDGKTFDINGFNEMLSLTRTPADDVYLQNVGDLLGDPVDDYIAEVIKKSLGTAVDWNGIQDTIDKVIADQVKALAQATDPFADGSAADNVAALFDTQDFRTSVHDQLQKTLREALGPHSAGFHDAVMKDPLFANASQMVQDMMKSFPFVDGVTSQVFKAMTAMNDAGVSYFDARMSASVLAEKKIYFDDPARKTTAQEKLAERVSALGDLSNLDKDIATTSAEITQSQADLTQINENLLKTPDDKKLTDQRDALERAINTNIEKQRELEQKEQERRELEQAGAETDESKLEEERQEADRQAETSGKDVFEGRP